MSECRVVQNIVKKKKRKEKKNGHQRKNNTANGGNFGKICCMFQKITRRLDGNRKLT